MTRITQLGFLALPMRVRGGAGPVINYGFDAEVGVVSKFDIDNITAIKRFSGEVAAEISMKGSVQIHE